MILMNHEELLLNLEDNEWPLTTIDHDRLIARAIVVDDEKNFYFVRANRDDDFGKATLIETAGGGVEAGEDLNTAIRRELKEELLIFHLRHPDHHLCFWLSLHRRSCKTLWSYRMPEKSFSFSSQTSFI